MVAAMNGDRIYKILTWIIGGCCIAIIGLLGLVWETVSLEQRDNRRINEIQTNAISLLCAEMASSKEDRRHIQTDLVRVLEEMNQLKALHMKEK